MIKEGKVILDVPAEASRKLPVFYNPVMKLNRDISVLLVNALSGKQRIADVLSGSGARAVRLSKECKNAGEVFANDSSASAVKYIKKNARMNKAKLNISQKDASVFLLESEGFSYIDIDPFGSPNPFLDAAVRRISRGGIIALTATDTSALSGSHPKAGFRKYWARPLRFWGMHEFGIRILARKAQLVGGQYDKALVPVFCHSTAHYVRLYLECQKGKSKVDEVYRQHKFVHFCQNCLAIKTSADNVGVCCKKPVIVAGPLWSGQLWKQDLVKRMQKNAKDESKLLLDVIAKEAKIQTVGFHDWYEYCSKLRRAVPKRAVIIEKIRKLGYKVAPTHFSSQGLRSEISSKEFLQLL